MRAKNVDMNIEAVKKAIEESSLESKIYIGCDSAELGRNQVAFVTVVIIHRDGKHGGSIYKDVKIETVYGRKKEKIYQKLIREVGLVAEFASHFTEEIGDRHFEIHLDINPDEEHGSNVVMREAVGWILGTFGVTPKLKPEAFAASHASDMYAVKIRDGQDNKRHMRKKRRNHRRKMKSNAA